MAQVPASFTETGSSSARGPQEQLHSAVFSVLRGASNAHKFSVSRWVLQPSVVLHVPKITFEERGCKVLPV